MQWRANTLTEWPINLLPLTSGQAGRSICSKGLKNFVVCGSTA